MSKSFCDLLNWTGKVVILMLNHFMSCEKNSLWRTFWFWLVGVHQDTQINCFKIKITRFFCFRVKQAQLQVNFCDFFFKTRWFEITALASNHWSSTPQSGPSIVHDSSPPNRPQFQPQIKFPIPSSYEVLATVQTSIKIWFILMTMNHGNWVIAVSHHPSN